VTDRTGRGQGGGVVECQGNDSKPREKEGAVISLTSKGKGGDHRSETHWGEGPAKGIFQKKWESRN